MATCIPDPLGLQQTAAASRALSAASLAQLLAVPDVDVVHLTGSVVEGWRQQMRRRRLSRQTMVAVRRDGRWQVTAFHNTRVRPLNTSGPMVELGGRFVRWRTDRAKRKQR